MSYPTIESCIGKTPLVKLQRIHGKTSNTILVKLEGNNPAGSVKDRPALSMIQHAEARGDISPGDTLIEATSGNTGIALAMAAAIKGYKMTLIMPENNTEERKAAMLAYGAELITEVKNFMSYPTIESCIGKTPLVKLQRIHGKTSNTILVKLEGNNPAGSVKDRPALSMIQHAEARGDISPGDTLIEATSGNTGIALAMAAAIKGYKMTLIMPENNTEERKAAMLAYGAELILVSKEASMEGARDLAKSMEINGKGKVLDQFGNTDNPLAHFENTGPEIWEQTGGKITHFVSSMGTTGTIMGVSRYLKSKNPDIQIIGLQPEEGASIPGIRRWPKEYLPSIYDSSRVDKTMDMGQQEAENCMKLMATQEGIFCGVSSGGNVAAALRLSKIVRSAVIVAIICDRGDRYLSSGVYV